MIKVTYAELAQVQELLEEAVNTDGEQHKVWFLERIADVLGVELPNHDKGVAP